MPVRNRSRGGAARKYGDRLVLDGIFFVLRSGCQWRMIPRDLLPWDAAYRWYRAWTADGTWDRIHDALRGQVRAAAGRDPAPSAGVLDAQSVLTSEGGQSRGYDAGKRTRGRKRHIVTDTLGLLLAVMVTSASVQDRHGGKAILEQAAARFGSLALIWADAGYANQVDDGLVTWARAAAGVVLEIVKRSDDVKGFQVLPRRWVVERTLCAARRFAVSPAQPGGIRREVPGSNGLPGSERLRGQQHARKPGGRVQWSGTARRGDPRDMAKAGLPESQSPVDASSHPPERPLKPAPCSASESKVAGAPPEHGATPSEGVQGDEWGAYVTLTRTAKTNAGSPAGREPQGDGGLVVVAGVTTGQGGRESRPQGEGGQVIGHRQIGRYA